MKILKQNQQYNYVLTKILKVNCITPQFPNEIKVDKINTKAEPKTGAPLKRTIRFVLVKDDFDMIKSWMTSNDKNHFKFFQKMPFYLMAPNGKIIDWSPRPGHNTKIYKDSGHVTRPDKVSGHNTKPDNEWLPNTIKATKRKRNQNLSPDRICKAKKMIFEHHDGKKHKN